MIDLEKIEKGMFRLWQGEGWLLYTQHFKNKNLKFFLTNPKGEYRVRLKEKILYEGKDLDEAIRVYNEI